MPMRLFVPRPALCPVLWSLLLAPALAVAQDPPATKPVDPTPPPAQVPATGDQPAEKAKSRAAESKKAATPAEPATVPASRPGNWMKMHDSFVERTKQGDVDLLFMGDSITAGWRTNGPKTWDRYYGPRHAANFGIGGDRTQHVLWRLEHGEADGIKPKVVVLMIGTNNLDHNPEGEVVAGVRAVVDSLRGKFPEAKVLLLGIFPRRAGADRDKSLMTIAPDPRVGRVNSQLATFDDGKAVRYLDIGRVFLDDQGQVPRAGMPDLLHLNAGSYAKWADAIEPTLWELMEAK